MNEFSIDEQYFVSARITHEFVFGYWVDGTAEAVGMDECGFQRQLYQHHIVE